MLTHVINKDKHKNMTYGELVSGVINTFNSVKKDMRIPKRLILHEFKNNAQNLLSQKLRDRSLFREEDLFQWINCVELKSDDIVKCPIIEFRSCRQLMKSKKKLPKMINSKFGASILMVTTIDGEQILKVKSITEYKIAKKGRYYDKFKGKYAYIADGYLYIPDSEIEAVNILLLSLDEDCEEASECSDVTGCTSIWDREVKISTKILGPAMQMTIQKISMRFNIPTDENANLNLNDKTNQPQR